MERKLNSPSVALIHPASRGWQVRLSGAGAGTSRFETLSEAAASLAADCQVEIALPVSLVVVERLSLPALDREELRGMVHLQLEKSLPFPIEDVTCDFQVIRQEDSESRLLAIAVNNAHFASLCQPLRERSLLPQSASFFALQLAQFCPKDQTSLLVYQEDQKKVLAIFEDRKLAFIQLLPNVPDDELLGELPALLFGAELDGVDTEFSGVYLDRSLSGLGDSLRSLLSLPVELIDLDQFTPQPGCDLLPESFQRERKQQAQKARLKSNLVTAASVYLLLLALGFGCLIYLQRQVSKVDAKIAALQPDMDFVKTRVAHWNELAPAIDKQRFVVELLYQVFTSLPSDGIRITNFELSKDQFMVEGEAPSAALAIEFGDQLKKNPALQAYQFEIGPPTLLANEHAQMRIIGKL